MYTYVYVYIIFMSLLANESCHAVRKSHFTHMHEACYTYVQVGMTREKLARKASRREHRALKMQRFIDGDEKVRKGMCKQRPICVKRDLYA